MSRGGRVAAEVLVVLAGLALSGVAWWLRVEWSTRHFSVAYPQLVTVARVLLVASALGPVLFVRPRVGRWAGRVGVVAALSPCVRLGLAIVLALVASEVGLRVLDLPRPHGVNKTDSLAEPAPRYGWLFKASRSLTIDLGERPVRYDFNAEHDRASAVDDLPDPKRPSLLFLGESIMSGHGLAWEESLPAIVGKALDLQVVNLAVDGYATDQAFLRLRDALPRYDHPVAIVTTYLPLMTNRIARVDHPRLVFDGVEVKLVPPSFVQSLRLTQTFSESTGFHPDWAIETTAEVFRQTERLARERNARAVFVTPYLGTEWPRIDDYLIDELLVRHGLTVVNPRFGYEPMPGDPHPDPASTRRLAEAVIAELRALPP